MTNFFKKLFIVLSVYIQIIAQNNQEVSDILDYSDASCNNNPFLFLLPDDMRHTIQLTLSKKPKKQSLSFCKNKNISKTCCTSFTYNNIKTYLTDHIYTPKYNIYETNLYYYKNVIDEHRRNIVKGFGLSTSEFENLFNKYHQSVKEIIQLSEDIVQDSVTYNWNAFCNYICNFPESLKNCEITRINRVKEWQHFFDFEYSCGIDQQFLEQFKGKLAKFQDMKNNFNNTINEFYAEIKSQEVNVKKFIKKDLFQFYTKSIEDGQKVSLKLNDEMLCQKNKTTKFTNERATKEEITVDTTCDNILNKPCGLFNCLDDFFLQFFDIHENNNTHILKQFNYTKTKINPKKQDELIYYDFKNEIKKLAGDKIEFANKAQIKISLLILFLYFFLLIN